MKKYIILLLFFINFAFVFQHGKIELAIGVEVRAQGSPEGGDGYFSGWSINDWEDFITSGEADALGINGTIYNSFDEYTAANGFNDVANYLTDNYISEFGKTLIWQIGGLTNGTDFVPISLGGLYIKAKDLDHDGILDYKYVYNDSEELIYQGGIGGDNNDPITQTDKFFDWLQQNYGSEVPEVITDGIIDDYYNDQIFSDNNSITTEAEDLTLDSDGGKKPFVSTEYPAAAKAEADYVKNTLSATADISSKCTQLKNYSQSKTYEYGISVKKVNGVYSIYVNQQGQTLQTQNTTSGVNIEYNSTAVINAHNHTTPSPVGIQSLSSADIKSLGKGYVYCKDHGGDYKASVAYLANNGEAMAYVDSKDKLNKFLATKEGIVFLDKGVSDETSKIGQEFKRIKKELQKEGYSTSTSYRYAMIYTLDYFQTGINIFYKEPGTTDFKLQSIQLETTNLVPATIVNGVVIFDEYKIVNYKPIISK